MGDLSAEDLEWLGDLLQRSRVGTRQINLANDLGMPVHANKYIDTNLRIDRIFQALPKDTDHG